MAGRPRYTAADVPYFLERDTITGNAARPRREQRRPAREPSRYRDDEDLIPLQDRGFYPPLSHQFNSPNPQEPSRRGRQYHAPSPSDSYDAETEFGRCGRRSTHCPPLYDDAVDDESIFDHERRRGFRRHDLGNDRLPLYARRMEMDDFDEDIFRDMSLDPRNPRYQRGIHGSRDRDLNQSYGLEPRVTCGMEPHLDEFDSNLDMTLREDLLDFGRAGMRSAGRYGTRHRLEDDFEDGILEDDSLASRQHRRSHLPGDRSDLDFQFVDDDIEDEYTGGFRAPTAAEIRHRQFLVQMYGELDAEELDAKDRKQERQEALIEKEYEEYFESDDVGRWLRDGRGQIPRAAGPRPATNLSDSDIDEFPHGRRGHLFRPREAGNRQTPRQNPRANGGVERSRDRNQQAPPSYDSVIPAQLHTRTQAEPDSDANHPLIAAAVPDNAKSHSVAAAIANKAAEATAERASKNDPHAKLGRTAHNGAKAIQNRNNLDTAPPQRAAHKVPLDSEHTPRAELGVNGQSDSSDSGFDTPDEDSETSGARDEDLGGGDFVQSFIRITL